MTKLSIALLTASLLLVAAPLATAEEPSEGQADCEEGQQWIGYTSSDSFREFVTALLGDNAAVAACEGEHWDGEDTVAPDASGSRDAPCTYSDPTPESITVSNCQPADPNDGSPSVGAGVVGIRLSTLQSEESQQAYLAVDIFGVGKAVVYAGHCSGNGAGLEGANCEGSQQGRGGVYLQDNTNQIGLNNVLATIVSSAGITKGYVAEADCDQETYAEGANTGNRNLCGRDNTAISADLLLP